MSSVVVLMLTRNFHSHDRVGIYATFLRVGVFPSPFGAASSKETAHGRIFRATVCGVKVGCPCCRCVRGPPAPLKRIEPRMCGIGRCILNHVLIIIQLATYVTLDARTPFFSEKRSFLRKIWCVSCHFRRTRRGTGNQQPMLQSGNLG